MFWNVCKDMLTTLTNSEGRGVRQELVETPYWRIYYCYCMYIYTVFFLFNRYAKQRAFLLACTYLLLYSLSMCKMTLFHSLSMRKLTLLTIEKLAKCSIKWHILSPISTDCDRARKGSREGKTGTVLELSLGVSDPCKVCFYSSTWEK